MKMAAVLRVLAGITAQQWGLVTSAQASLHGVTRLNLSRLTESGHLERLAHGIYRNAGTPSTPFTDLQTAWLSTDPKLLAEQRLRDRAAGVVVAGASAARLHDIGTRWATHLEFVCSQRCQSQRPEIRYRQRNLDPRDVTLVHGLPTMTIERTIADLVEEAGELSLVSDTLRSAALTHNLDLARLRELLAPLAGRNGLKKNDGGMLLCRLLQLAGIDIDTAGAYRLAANASPISGVLSAAHMMQEAVTDGHS